MSFNKHRGPKRAATNALAFLPIALLIASGCQREPAIDHDQALVQVENAWVRQVPASSRMTAAYFSVNNLGKEPLTISAIESPDFQSATFHSTLLDNGVSRMRELDDIVIQPGDSLVLEPGAIHVMLGKSNQTIDTLQNVELTLSYGAGEQLTFVAAVSKTEPK